MGLNDGKHLERIKTVNDRWILIEYNEDASIAWAGLPFTTKRSDDENEKNVNKLIIPESALEKGHDVKEWERIFKVVGVGPNAWQKQDGTPMEPVCEEGDFVIAKGSAPTSIAINPPMYAVWAENIVCVLDLDVSSVKTQPKKSYLDMMADKIGKK